MADAPQTEKAAPKAEKPKGERKAKEAAAAKPRAPKPAGYTPRMKERYVKSIRAKMKEEFKYTNEMQIPRLEKIVLNMGGGEAAADHEKGENRQP